LIKQVLMHDTYAKRDLTRKVMILQFQIEKYLYNSKQIKTQRVIPREVGFVVVLVVEGECSLKREHTPWKLLRCLTQETGVSKS